MRIEILILVFFVSLGIAFLSKKNIKKSKSIKKRMQHRVDIIRKMNNIKESSDSQHEISSYIIKLIKDSEFHKMIGLKLNDSEIQEIENKLGLPLPKSYKLFLKYFGDGAEWVYYQSIDSIQNFSWLTDYRKHLRNTIQLNSKNVKTDSLLCLMTEDSNGGAWCWLTNENNHKEEWSLAYYINDELHYKPEFD